MGFLKDLVHKASADPVTQAVVKVDPLAKAVNATVVEAVDTGWGKPLGKDKSGADVIGAGPLNYYGIGGDPNKPEDRAVGRAVGSIFAGYGIGAGANAAGVSSSTVSTVKTVGNVAIAADQAKSSREQQRSAAGGSGSAAPPVPIAFDFSVPADQVAARAPQAAGLGDAQTSSSASSGSWTRWLQLAIPLIGVALSLNPRHAS